MNDSLKVFSPERLGSVQTCLGARRRAYDAGELLVREGERVRSFGIILSGAVNVVRYGVEGDEKVLTHLEAGQVFGTSFVLGGEVRSFASILAVQPTTVLFLQGDRVLRPCATRCPSHVDLLCHLLGVIAHRNTLLARKLDCLSQRTTAKKLLAYLEMQAQTAGSNSFTIPFTRQQLADYLNVDRAALSREIGKLARKGVLATNRRTFRLLCRPTPV